MNTAILANGQIDDLNALLPSIRRHRRVIAVDAGLAYCKQGGFAPDLIVGDFDSCPAELLKDYSSVPKMTLPSDKDITDLEAAIAEEWKRGVQSITVYGAWGKRIDHSLTNALILGRHSHKLIMETETEIAFAIQGRTQLSSHPGQTVSLIPIFGRAESIRTNGFKWELTQRSLDRDFIGISNIALIPNPTIEIASGQLLCCQIKITEY